MATDDAAKQRGNHPGPTARTVAANVKRVRRAQGMRQQELSDRARAMGHYIPVASVGKIESGDRRVEVDDLIVLAGALGVSPLALLLPASRISDEPALLTGQSPHPAEEVWSWAIGAMPLGPLDGDPEDIEEQILSFQFRTRPWWFTVASSVEAYDATNAAHRVLVRRHWDSEEQDETNG